MRTNVVGRVRNMNLPKSQGLLPLFEAIINSIDSIEDSRQEPNVGQIDIFITRAPELFSGKEIGNEDMVSPITGFAIVDNGIGFTDSNYESLNEADTLNKVNRGGKGVGRFTWLRAFEEVKIESSFSTPEGIGFRSFEFVLADPDCIKSHYIELNSSKTEIRTNVSLIGYKDEYDKYIPRTSSSIAQRIVEHCLEYFVFSKMPHCLIHDSTDNSTINLDDVYDKFVADTQTEKLIIDKHKFELIHFYLHARADLKHHICFCANNRVVTSENILNKIYNLPSALKLNDSEEEYIYAGYVSSSFLDSHINSQRTEFYFSQDGNLLLDGELTKNKIESDVLNSISNHLSQSIEAVKFAKIEQIREFVNKEAPEYRYIINNHTDRLDKLSPDLTSEKLDIALYEIHRDIETEVKKEGVRILQEDGLTSFGDGSKEDIYNRFAKWWQESNEVGKANLAKYIILRKNTLDVMEKALASGVDGKYSREEIIHEIIFPLKKSSDDIQYEQHNLWLIDERLAYHRYLASDIKLNRNKMIETPSESRPDLILFFNRAIALVDEEPPYNGIVIFEFKRPMRNDYSDEENPIQQVYSYISEIKSGKALNKDGRPITIHQSTPFYSYIICDITATLRIQAQFAGLHPTPDNNGFFGFNESFSTYIEIISFDKILTDAKKRNRILFEKLNLPNKIL